MKRKLIEYVVCPECKGNFTIECFHNDGIEVEEGVLLCDKGHMFPIINGVPRLLPRHLLNELIKSHPEFINRYLDFPVKKARNTNMTIKTMKSFGYQWNKFDNMYDFWEEEFLDYIYPIGKEFFSNKLGLDAGCGMGRFIFYGAKYGAEMIGVDLSNAVEAAYRNNKYNEKVHIVQADIYNLPFRPSTFDFVYSIGVLHHLPKPKKGFESLLPFLKPKGDIFIWVYGKASHTLWQKLRKVLQHIQHIPYSLINSFSFLIAICIWSFFIIPNRIRHRLGLIKKEEMKFRRWTFKPFRVVYADCFDQLSAPIAFYYDKQDIRKWFADNGLTSMMIASRDKNSWRAYGRT
ncbi:MAG: methyltransferase domain-containing protein [Deltaproteobacteria bacterium]|nr:methyltransferase domain-containing protein [Deltaproteobacteria bacterium]